MKAQFKLATLAAILLTASTLTLAANTAGTADSALDTESVQIIQVPGTPPADNASSARTPGASIGVCPLTAISPTTGTAGTYVAGVCVTVGGVFKKTGTGTAKQVMFNNLAPGSQAHVFTSLGRPAKTAAVTIPAGKTSSTCSAVKFNAAGGLNYIVNVAVGWSTFPGAQYCP